MTYFKKTSNFFKIFYAVLAGVALIAWMFTIGVSGKEGSNGFFSIKKASADEPHLGGPQCDSEGFCTDGGDSEGCGESGGCDPRVDGGGDSSGDGRGGGGGDNGGTGGA